MLYDLVLRNRSYRGYDSSRSVTLQELTDMVACARVCPSSVNIQPFRYYLSWEKDEVEQLFRLTKWAKGLPALTLPHPGMEPTAFIVILQDQKISENLARHQKDCGIVAQTMLLRAVEMGLGGCMIGSFPAGALRETLGLPQHLAPLLMIAIGKPGETVVLEDAPPGADVGYYRDEQDVHHVPKRRLEDVLLTRNS